MGQFRNEPRVASLFKNPCCTRGFTKVSHFAHSDSLIDFPRGIRAIAGDSGSILIYEDLLLPEILYLFTDSDVGGLAFVSLEDPSLIVLHSHGLIRVWNIRTGTIAREVPLNTDVISVFAASGQVWARGGDNSIFRIAMESGAVICNLAGFSKSSEIRHLTCKESSPIIGVVDGFGQTFLYSVDPLQLGNIEPIVSEKLYAEAFHLDFSDTLLVLTCPLKVILYKFDPARKTLEPIKSVMTEIAGTRWRSVCVFSNRRALGFTSDARVVDLSTEDVIKQHPDRRAEIRQAFALNGNRFLLHLENEKFEEGILLADTLIRFQIFASPSKSTGSPLTLLQTFASDGNHLFQVESDGESIHASPLSIGNCSFQLETPPSSDAGNVTAISGLVLNNQIVAGFSKGQVCGWVVGSSKMDFHISCVTDGLCPMLDFAKAINGPNTWFTCLDAAGTITIVDKGQKMFRMKPNMLIPLLMRGYTYSVTCTEKVIECVVQHYKERSLYSEKWSLETKSVVDCKVVERVAKTATQNESTPSSERRASFQLTDIFFPSSRRASVEVEKPQTVRRPIEASFSAEVEILKGIFVRKCWGFQQQIISFDALINALPGTPTDDLLAQLFLRKDDGKRTTGLSCVSSVTGTVQACFMLQRSAILSTCLDLMGDLPNSYNLSLEFLFGLLKRSQYNEVGKRVLSLIQREILRQNVSSLDISDPLVVLVAFGVCPHALPGYKTAISEIEASELPLSESTHKYITIVEGLLKRIHDKNASWFDYAVFSNAFPFVRKLIQNKSLFHDVFGILYETVRFNRDVLATNCLLVIGSRNPTKFAKRLALLVKTTHESDVPLMLIRKLVERYRIDSMRFLSVLFETVVLPCLDPMDYRTRKSSVDHVTDLFKTLNRLFPMTTFHQNRQKFALGTTQGQVVIYDVRSATKWRILDGHTGAISAVGFDYSGKNVCTYSATDCTVRVWHLSGGALGSLVVSGNPGGSVLGGLLGSSGGKCTLVKQLGPIDEHEGSIKHPFDLNYRINGVKVKWTSETDILIVRETGQGIQIRL
jgi:WD40 repeat protein